MKRLVGVCWVRMTRFQKLFDVAGSLQVPVINSLRNSLVRAAVCSVSEITADLVDRGSTFISGVLDRADEVTLARLWNDPKALPTPNEVDAPGLWLARIDLPELDQG